MLTLQVRFSMIFLIGAGPVTNLRIQPIDRGFDVRWLPPTGYTDDERELITGYSVRWCTHTTNSARSSSSDCKSKAVLRDSLSFQITGIEEGITYNVSVKVNTRIENNRWSSTLASTSTSVTDCPMRFCELAYLYCTCTCSEHV